MATEAGSFQRDEQLADKTIIVAGASGAVGSVLVERLSAAGCRIGIPARKPGKVTELQHRWNDPSRLVAHVPSTDSEAAAGFVKGVTDSLGPIDALLSTVGAFAYAPVGRDPAGTDLHLLEANFLAVHNLVRAVVPPMIRRETGRIVLTGASAVWTNSPGIALYRAAKSALHAYAECVAAEVADRGVTVRVIAPGTIDTAANRAAMPDADRSEWVSIDRVVDDLVAAIRSDGGRGDPAVRPLEAAGRG